MAETVESARALGRPAVLGVGEQVARDARTRVVAAAGVVLVHSTHPPGSAVLESMSPAAQGVSAAVYSLAVTFPVHAFVLLSFLNLVPRLDAGVPSAQLLRGAFGRLVPAHLFWVSVYLAVRAALEGRLPSPEQLLTGALLGTAADHLYFTPLLITLTACAALWGWMAKRPLRAAVSALGLALVATALRLEWGHTNPWLGALLGPLGMGSIAVAGLWLGRAWGGVAPGPAQVRWIVFGVGGAVLVCAVALGSAALQSGGQPLPLTGTLWLSRLGMALGVPVLLLAVPGRVPMRLIRIAPYTLGVYFLHPLSIKAVQWLEARVPALTGMEAALILPNAVLAALCSLGAVVLLARTPLRRCVI
ncbi:MAG: acyltransferase [Myxococcota bacterium]|nr:acyltransferase [Myxococcota bacterium]